MHVDALLMLLLAALVAAGLPLLAWFGPRNASVISR